MDILFIVIVIAVAIAFLVVMGLMLEPYTEHMNGFESFLFGWLVLATLPWSMLVLMIFGDEIKKVLAKRTE